MARDLSKRDYVYVWVDGIHTGVRLGGDDRLCCLVMVGARLDGMYDYPAEHWRHLRTTNPIESTFAPVRARTDVTKGPGSRQAGLAMIYTLVEASEGRWRKLTGAHLVALVRAGAEFRNGELVEGTKDKVAA
jgi:transposase-like protein